MVFSTTPMLCVNCSRNVKWVVVKGRNRRGKEVRIKSSGFTARAFQHELDHLDGILFIDRLTNLDTLRRVEDLEADEQEAAVAAASG